MRLWKDRHLHRLVVEMWTDEPPWNPVWGFLKKLQIELTCDPATQLLNISMKTWSQHIPWSFLHLQAFTIIKIRRQPRGPPADRERKCGPGSCPSMEKPSCHDRWPEIASLESHSTKRTDSHNLSSDLYTCASGMCLSTHKLTRKKEFKKWDLSI